MPRQTPRITVTLPPELVQRIRARVGQRETSSWVARAIAERLAREDLLAALAGYEAEAGPITEADIAAAKERTAWRSPRAQERDKPPAA